MNSTISYVDSMGIRTHAGYSLKQNVEDLKTLCFCQIQSQQEDNSFSFLVEASQLH
eukprot:c42078_g1_i1 orf=98-265(+)